MSTPSDPPPPASPMPLDSIESELIFLAEHCRLAKLAGDFDNAQIFWRMIHKGLDQAFKALVKKWYPYNDSDWQEFSHVATLEVWNKIEHFDLSKSHNSDKPFTNWAWYHVGREAVRSLLVKHNYNLSRDLARHKKAIEERIQHLFPQGPKYGQPILEFAIEHVDEIADPPALTETMIRNTLAAWGFQDAGDIDNTDQAIHEGVQGFTRQDIEWALEQLDSKHRQFWLDCHVTGLSHKEIGEKHQTSEANAKTIVHLACKHLREVLGRME